MSSLPLAQVTLCAVDTRTPALAVQSLLQSMQNIDFGRVLLFTYDWLPHVVLPGIQVVEIEPLRSAAEYARFVMRQLPGYVRTSHALLTHWDGFVVNPAAWNDEFLVYDYVGSTGLDALEERVSFHGPMSLRSRRLLLAGMDPRIPDGQPEDVVLCKQQRAFLESAHGVIFAPEALARRFVQIDGAPSPVQLGFQGVGHLARLLPDTEINRWLDEPGSDFFTSPAARTLLLALVAEGKSLAAQKLLERRRQVGCVDNDVTLLSTAARVMGVLRAPAR